MCARPRKPVELMSKNLTKDELEKRKAAELELVGDRDLLIKPPKYLNKAERKIYKQLLDPLIHIKTLSNADRQIFGIMANAKYMMDLANKEIENSGMLIQKIDRFGNLELKENPAIKIYKQYENIFRLNATQVGLSPAARAKLIEVKEENKAEDELNEILGSLRG